MFSIEEERKKIPDAPGVYLHKDRMGQVIYVGKAISLKKRINQYFQSSKSSDSKIKALVASIAEFEYITCNNEMEAFVLEDNLIKEYKPKYNILLRDDKTYPYIKMTLKDPWPRLVKTRRMNKDGNLYFGPYTDVGAVNQMIELLNDVFALKRCQPVTFPKAMKPCLHYHIGYCEGMCIGKGNKKEYGERIKEVERFLKGKDNHIVHYLKNQMERASQEMRYEEAARLRDCWKVAQSLNEKQRVAFQYTDSVDVVMSLNEKYMVVFSVRNGKLVGRETYTLETEFFEEEGAKLNAFFRQHYGLQGEGPKEILVSRLPVNKELIQEYLNTLWHHKVRIYVPQKGEKKALLDLAAKDVEELKKNISTKEKNKQEREEAIQRELDDLLESEDLGKKKQGLYRIEAYDISNTNGLDTVGAAVTFVGSKPHKKAYRKFKVKTVEGPDDYGSTQEVLFRRLRRGLEGDASFLPLPDILFMDGGKGHVSSAKAVLNALNLSIPLFGMVKDRHHRTHALVSGQKGAFKTISFEGHPLLYSYLGRVQEEVHRFAISYHRKTRENKKLVSALDQIPGVGPKKKNALLHAFGSVKGVKQATREDLEKVPGIYPALAKKINEYFH